MTAMEPEMPPTPAPLRRDRLWTTRELADYVHQSPRTIERRIAQGSVPFLRLPGGAVRFDPRAVDRWTESLQNLPPRPTRG